PANICSYPRRVADHPLASRPPPHPASQLCPHRNTCRRNCRRFHLFSELSRNSAGTQTPIIQRGVSAIATNNPVFTSRRAREILLASSAVVVLTIPATAGDATWLQNPGTANFN